MNRHEFDLEQLKSLNISDAFLSGSDEVGRGSMGGPEVVASVILKKDYFNPMVKDSKQLTRKQREELYDEIIANSVSYSIKAYNASYVDEHNPLQTSVNGMIETINDLVPQPNICLIDGNQKMHNNEHKYVNLVKGDAKSQTISAASILAKVFHDRLMDELDEKYPEYGFASHVGYCTKAHKDAVEKYGVIKGVHRESYAPIKKILNEGGKYHD